MLSKFLMLELFSYLRHILKEQRIIDMASSPHVGADSTDGIRVSGLKVGYTHRRSAPVVVSGPLEASASEPCLTCLIGENGAGKYTPLRTHVGLQPPISGDVTCHGRSLCRMSAARRAREVAVVLTDKPFTGNMTAAEVVATGRSPYTGFWGIGGQADRDAVMNALRLAGISHKATCPLTQMSDGERQKVMIAKALAQDTPVVVLDEPTAFLDYPGKALTMRLLRRLAHEQHKTVIVSSHDLELVLQMADKLWMLTRQGIVEGTPHELAQSGCLGRFLGKAGLRLDADDLHISMPMASVGQDGDIC